MSTTTICVVKLWIGATHESLGANKAALFADGTAELSDMDTVVDCENTNCVYLYCDSNRKGEEIEKTKRKSKTKTAKAKK